MKILLVNALFPPFRYGGAEVSVSLLARGLAKTGDDVVVVTLHDEEEQTVERDADGIAVYRLPLDNLYWPWGGQRNEEPAWRRLGWHLRNMWNRKAARRVAAILREERPDVIHCNVLTGFSPAVWGEADRLGIPVVQTLRDYGLMCVRSAMFRSGRQCQSRCADCALLTTPARRGSSGIDQLVAISDHVGQAHRDAGYFEGVPGRRIFNIAGLGPAPARPPAAPDAPLTFGFLGRVEVEKGIEVLLDACGRLGGRDWHLRIGGEGVPAYVETLKRRYPDPRIEWLGNTDASAFFATIDLLVVPSIWPEPLGRILIEALEAGLSVISSDAGGLPEIAQFGKRAEIYPATDPRALAALLNRSIDDPSPWRDGGFRSDDDIDRFSEATIIAAHRSVYSDAVDGRRGVASATGQAAAETVGDR